jgi:hypothetical protein
LFEQMRHERESWKPQWMDCARYVKPMRGKYHVSDNNKGDRRNQHIIDNTATVAARTLAAGMMSGITNPARPWFKLSTPDAELNGLASVKEWLAEVENRMFVVLAKSNAYNELQVHYGDLGIFGTAATLCEEDDDDIVRFQTFPNGSYFLANDAYGRVRYFGREFQMSVSAMVERFGEDAPFSGATQSLIDRHQWRAQVEVRHLIMPNPKWNPAKRNASAKRFVSYYWETGQSGRGYGNGPTQGKDDLAFLRVSGYDEFPVFGSRWEVSGEDGYGTDCPGFTALGDIRQLQLGERRKFQAAEKKISPPVQAPAALRNQQMSFAAATATFVPTANQAITPLYNVDFALQEWEFILEQARERIRKAFYADLWLMMQQIDRANITAREIQERHEEKLLALGPVLERLNKDLLNPLVDRVFNVMSRKGLLPPPPEEVEGMDLRVEYLSTMAQAQKLVGIGADERFASTMVGLAPVVPDVLDAWDVTEWAQGYADKLGVNPKAVNGPDAIAEIRAARAEAQAQAQQAEQAKMQADALASLSSAKLNEPNMLAEMMAQSGSGVPNQAAVSPQGPV